MSSDILLLQGCGEESKPKEPSERKKGGAWEAPSKALQTCGSELFIKYLTCSGWREDDSGAHDGLYHLLSSALTQADAWSECCFHEQQLPKGSQLRKKYGWLPCFLVLLLPEFILRNVCP